MKSIKMIQQKNSFMKSKYSPFITGIAIVIFFTQFTFRYNQQKEFDLKASIERGKDVYITYCLSCHKEAGEGIEGLYPPVAKSDYLMADKKRSIEQVLYGATGEMIVNGKTYNVPMAGIDLTDVQTSDVLNYIRNSWENKGKAVTPDEVKATRKK